MGWILNMEMAETGLAKRTRADSSGRAVAATASADIDPATRDERRYKDVYPNDRLVLTPDGISRGYHFTTGNKPGSVFGTFVRAVHHRDQSISILVVKDNNKNGQRYYPKAWRKVLPGEEVDIAALLAEGNAIQERRSLAYKVRDEYVEARRLTGESFGEAVRRLEAAHDSTVMEQTLLLREDAPALTAPGIQEEMLLLSQAPAVGEVRSNGKADNLHAVPEVQPTSVFTTTDPSDLDPEQYVWCLVPGAQLENGNTSRYAQIARRYCRRKDVPFGWVIQSSG